MLLLSSLFYKFIQNGSSSYPVSTNPTSVTNLKDAAHSEKTITVANAYNLTIPSSFTVLKNEEIPEIDMTTIKGETLEITIALSRDEYGTGPMQSTGALVSFGNVPYTFWKSETYCDAGNCSASTPAFLYRNNSKDLSNLMFRLLKGNEQDPVFVQILSSLKSL